MWHECLLRCGVILVVGSFGFYAFFNGNINSYRKWRSWGELLDDDRNPDGCGNLLDQEGLSLTRCRSL